MKAVFANIEVDHLEIQFLYAVVGTLHGQGKGNYRYGQ